MNKLIGLIIGITCLFAGGYTTTPSMNTISYNSSTASYTVSWSSSTTTLSGFYLSHYELYEVNTGMTYTSYSRSKTFSGKPSGTYTYRARAKFTYGISPLFQKEKKNDGMQAMIASDVYSAWSNDRSVTVSAPNPVPSVPQLYSATAVSGRQVSLSWQNVGNETGYKVYRATSSGGSYSLVATMGANASSTTIQGLNQNETNYFKISAYNSTGESGYSNVASATTPQQARLKWVHGWRDNNLAFNSGSRDFVRNGLNGLTLNGDERVPFYTSTQGFVSARNSLVSQVGNIDDAVFIGHSFGGLVSRDLVGDRNWQNRIQGIVTVGTPNQGAAIVNNKPVAYDLISRFVVYMLQGPKATFSYYSGYKVFSDEALYKILYSGIAVYDAINGDSFADQTMHEMAKGTSHINRVNNRPENFEKASVILKETNDNELFRLLSSDGLQVKLWNSEESAINFWRNVIEIYARIAANYDTFANYYYDQFLYYQYEDWNRAMNYWYMYTDMYYLATTWWNGAQGMYLLPGAYKVYMLEGTRSDGLLSDLTQKYGSALNQFPAENSHHKQQNSQESRDAMRDAARRVLGID